MSVVERCSKPKQVYDATNMLRDLILMALLLADFNIQPFSRVISLVHKINIMPRNRWKNKHCSFTHRAKSFRPSHFMFVLETFLPCFHHLVLLLLKF